MGRQDFSLATHFRPPVIRPGDLLSKNEGGVPYRYEDENEVTHSVQGSRLVPEDPHTFFMWTRCGQDVGVREVYASPEKPTCQSCAEREADSHPMGSKERAALQQLRRADLGLARKRARIEEMKAEGEDPSEAEATALLWADIVKAYEAHYRRMMT